MTTPDWLLAITLFCCPLLWAAFEKAYDGLTSGNRRIWWQNHYEAAAIDYLEFANMAKFEMRTKLDVFVINWRVNAS